MSKAKVNYDLETAIRLQRKAIAESLCNIVILWFDKYAGQYYHYKDTKKCHFKAAHLPSINTTGMNAMVKSI